MNESFPINEKPLPVPERIVDVNVEVEWVQLFLRCAELEKQCDEERRQSVQAQRKLLLAFLDIADAFDRMLQHPLNMQEPVRALERQRKNLEVTRRMLQQKLTDAGVSRLDLLQTTADPALTDIEDAEERDDLPDQTIIREIMTGYRWHDQMLRRAKVVVSERSISTSE